MAQVNLDISGMTCAACSNRIEKQLSKMKGVQLAQVNLAMESAHVEYSSNDLEPKQLISRIEEIGYGASLEASPEENEARKNKETKKILWQFLASLPFTLPLISGMLFHHSHTSWSRIISIPLIGLALAFPVQFIFGFSFYKNAFKALKEKSSDMNVLVALGTSAAFGYSIYLSDQWGWLKPGAMLYFETSAMLISLILLGKWLEHRAKAKSLTAIRALMAMQPQLAFKKINGQWEEVKVDTLIPGDVLLVKPGGKIPVDGLVVNGTSYIDESLMTGESSRVKKSEGAFVIAGSINGEQLLEIKAEKIGKKTLLAQMAKKVKELSDAKAPIQRVADKISSIFVPVVLGIAALVFVIWYFFMAAGLSVALENTIAVLVIACPCALGLATPVSIMVAGERAAQNGILFKSGEYLELAHRLNVLVMDKTGTLTDGDQGKVIYNPNTSLNTFKNILWNLEHYSEHPLARQIVADLKDFNHQNLEVEGFENIPGKGIKASINGVAYYIGNQIFIQEILDKNNIDGKLEDKAVAYLTSNTEYLGSLSIEENVKQGVPQYLENLKNKNVEIHMLTGDNPSRAKSLADKLNIVHVRSQVSPEDKLNYVENLKAPNKLVAMVGDGVNDSLALSAADIGIAMGNGTEVALESAHVSLLRGDLSGLIKMINISKACYANIRQNFFWALAYNCLGIPLAAFGKLSPWVAGAAMSLSSVSVVLNALRLKRVKV